MNANDKSEMRITETMPVGIVLERRDSEHKWQDHQWRVTGVLPGGEDLNGSDDDWKILGRGDGWISYYAGSLEIELFHRETEGYKVNLSNEPPLLYIVLREGGEESGHEVEPFLATVCPYEAQDYQDSGEETVEGVPMPPDIADWLADFVERHHVDEPFVKRKLKKKTAENAFGSGPGRGRHHGR